MKKRILIALSALLSMSTTNLIADQGMWLVNDVSNTLYKNMQRAGVTIPLKDIYSEDQLSIKDAIVSIDHGQCSGSIISRNGLMITNHHCAYSDIHANSTMENNYLENGFWAKDRQSEIPIEGKSVTFLKKVEDVTDQIAIITDSLDKIGPRGFRFLGKLERAIQQRVDSKYETALYSMWKGQKFYLYYYETFNDVRLVGAPPVSVGAYGGEQDNWGWPQHKGDFALYRVYTAPNGEAAKYSPDNIPMQAEKYLKISTKGYAEGDYTMVIGYPGTTNRYVSSAELRQKFEITNPSASSIRRAKLNVWKKHMDQDPEVRLKYADKYFGISNYCDFAKWENLCIDKYDIIESRQATEKELSAWIAKDPARIAKYGTMLADLENLYNATAELETNKEYIRETLFMGADISLLAQRFKSLRTHFRHAKKINCKKHVAMQKFCKMNLNSIFNQCDIETDKELFIKMLEIFIDKVDKKYIDKTLYALFEEYDFDAEKLVNHIYSTSVLADRERFVKFLESDITKDDIEGDPMFTIANGVNMFELNKMEMAICDSLGFSHSDLKAKYTEAIYKMEQERGNAISPDANSTMRLTYGNVGGLSPRDGVRYDWRTTSKGVLEKHNPNDYDFCMKQDYKELLEGGKWGRWAENGKLYVDFVTDNDITGGNSGSSVLNAAGEVIGLAFDGNRESMAGDVQFNENGGKCVCVDIRYVLWVMEYYGKADNLINELEFN